MNWRSKNFLSLSMWAFGLLVAFIIPDNPRSYMIFKMLIKTVGFVIPAVGHVGTSSPIADVAQTYWATMWMVALIWLPAYFALSDEQIVPLDHARRNFAIYIISPVIAIAVFAYMAIFPFQNSRIGTLMVGSVWGLGIIGGLLFASMPLFARSLVTWCRNMQILRSSKRSV